jgi:hypothetical protein
MYCRTVGEKPGPPPGGEFLVVNSTLVILLLERWLTPSCPILYFVIEYKLAIEHSWTVGRRRTKTNTVTMVKNKAKTLVVFQIIILWLCVCDSG